MVTVPLGPAPLDITGVRAGDLNEFQITLKQGGRPMDLTGETITAQARRSVAAPEHLDAVITMTDAVNGVITLRWPGDAVRTWLGAETSAEGVWDLETSNGADPVTILAGRFTAELDVTHD